ncbi:Alanine--tRNA ligase [Acorus gramineus]|uniref:Alanine--tRNA ligase n=1 Tax=Acorus gramineus TaxID=55184 RepID=A0AAV8ZWR1_ACOGR|nr:Alanine--tRNA ligase [Acorus gramineus]
MVFSADESSNKVVVCAGVPEIGGRVLPVRDWLTGAMQPIKEGVVGEKVALLKARSVALGNLKFNLFRLPHLTSRVVTSSSVGACSALFRPGT